jgi:hypothetical protein
MADTEALRERVASFPRWHYEFDLGGVRTPILDRAHVNRHAQRRAYFFAPLTRLCGGSLAGIGLETEPAGANVPAGIALRQGVRRSLDAAHLWRRRGRSV